MLQKAGVNVHKDEAKKMRKFKGIFQEHTGEKGCILF